MFENILTNKNVCSILNFAGGSRKVMLNMEEILNMYYENNARKLRTIVDKILSGFGGISNKDYDDFYSIANEVFVHIMKKYDGKQNFDGYLYTCLQNKVKAEMTARNRRKRMADRMVISIDTPVGGDSDATIGDMIPSDFDMDSVVLGDMALFHDERMEKYLNSLNKIQRQIIEMKMEDAPVSEIKERLQLCDKQYQQHCRELKSFDKIQFLLSGLNNINTFEEDDLKMSDTVTMEKSKEYNLNVVSIARKMDKHILRFDHPLQREADQWSPAMKGNLISDILQGNPVPPLIFAEQVVNDVAIVWNLDGKQKCTNMYIYMKDGYKVSKNIRRWLITYQAAVVDSKGNPVYDRNKFPVYERREFDIRGKKFSELPEELQEKFTDYSFKITQYINCSGEDIAYHIARYNDGKPMSASQKGITRVGEEFAQMVKAISNMPFFREQGGYKVSEFRNGTIYRVVIESVMAANFIGNWKKKQEDMCEFIREHASCADFENFENLVGRLERVIRQEVSDMFDSRDSFLWFALFSRFIKGGMEDGKFIDFMEEFASSLHSKKIDGVSFDDLNTKATKDKNVVIKKMNHLERLMGEYLGNHAKMPFASKDAKTPFTVKHVKTPLASKDAKILA